MRALAFAWRSARTERGRFFGSVGGVAVAVVLVLFLLGVYQGVLGGTTGVVEGMGADVWVGQEDSLDLVLSVSLVPRTLEDRVRGVAGVASVTSMYGASTHAHMFHDEGPSADIYVVGFDATSGVGGPGDVAEGTAMVGREGVVVSRALVDAEGIGIGDRVHILDRTFTVVGVSETPTVGMFSYAFVDADVARDMFRFGEAASYLLIVTSEGADPAEVADAVEARAGRSTVDAVTSAEFARENGEVIRRVFDPILYTVIGLGFVVGLAVVAVTTWSAANERAADFGVLKAIGAEPRDLYAVIVAEAALSSLAGLLAGLPAYFALASAISRSLASVPVATHWRAVALALPASLAMALLASWLPVRRVARIDAAETLRRAV